MATLLDELSQLISALDENKTNKMEAKGHSEEYFGDFRDYWYNLDFLELMAKRWELENVKTLLDVGCG